MRRTTHSIAFVPVWRTPPSEPARSSGTLLHRTTSSTTLRNGRSSGSFGSHKKPSFGTAFCFRLHGRGIALGAPAKPFSIAEVRSRRFGDEVEQLAPRRVRQPLGPRSLHAGRAPERAKAGRDPPPSPTIHDEQVVINLH